MFNSQEQLLSSIAELVEDTIITVNPNPKIYKDSNGNPLIGGTQYTDSDLEETLTVVWALNDTIYMAIKEKKSYFAFTPKEFKLQFKSSILLPL